MQRIKSEISGSEKDVTGELRYKILLRAMTEMVESRMGAVAWGQWPTPRFPSPLIKPGRADFRPRLSDRLHRKAHEGIKPLWAGRWRHGTMSNISRPRHSTPAITAPHCTWCLPRLIANHHDLCHLQKAHQKSGHFCTAALPGINASLPRPTPAVTTACDAEAATLVDATVSPVTEPPFRRAVPYYPGGSRGCRLRHTCGLPQMTEEGRHPHELSRPARASLCYGPTDRSAAQGRALSSGLANQRQLPGRAHARQLPINRQLSG